MNNLQFQLVDRLPGVVSPAGEEIAEGVHFEYGVALKARLEEQIHADACALEAFGRGYATVERVEPGPIRNRTPTSGPFSATTAEVEVCDRMRTQPEDRRQGSIADAHNTQIGILAIELRVG